MMGGVNCCQNKPKDTTSDKNHKDNVDSREEAHVIASHDTSHKQSISSDLTFPRYPVLPSIEAHQAAIVCSNGDTLAHGDTSSIMNFYNRYVDHEIGFISAEGIEKLCDDLELDPEDFRVLVLAYSLNAEVMCRFTEDEFVKGCKHLDIHNIESMKAAIPRLLDTVKNKSFGPFYRWAFKFALDTETGQRTLPTELAVSLWKLVFSQNYPSLLEKWLFFLEHNCSVKGISKDTWDMFLVFTDQIQGDLSKYDDTEAWPSLLDEFVESELASEAMGNCAS